MQSGSEMFWSALGGFAVLFVSVPDYSAEIAASERGACADVQLSATDKYPTLVVRRQPEIVNGAAPFGIRHSSD